uniref:GDT1 family protein n=1 Tax=Aplanochytrium stocchinoi TaxID=215587 RepID=A0A7S3V291_9STRA
MKWYVHLLAAAFLVFATMGDDALYLVVYLTSSRFSRRLRLWNGFIFCAVLQSTVWLSYGAVLLFGKTLSTSDIEPTKKRLASIAAGIGWLLSFFLFLKWCRKRIRKRIRSHDAYAAAFNPVEAVSTDIDTRACLKRNGDYYKTVHSDPDALNISNANYGTLNGDSELGANTVKANESTDLERNGGIILKRHEGENEPENFFEVTSTVLVLAILGALDELCYFPSLLMSETFDVIELSLGALLASIAMVSVLTFALPRVQPLLQFLDSIPLFIIVCTMSIVMTIDAVKANSN